MDAVRRALPIVCVALALGGAGAFALTRGPAQSVDCGFGEFGERAWPTACWRPYTDDSFFNRPLPGDPTLVANSEAMIARIMRMGPIPEIPVNPEAGGDYFHPVFWSRPEHPEYTVRCVKYGGECEISGMKVRIPPQARPAAGSDAHMAVIDQRTGWEYDFWQVQTTPLAPGGGEIVMSYGGRTRITGPGGGTPDAASDATAAHVGLAGGIIRHAELAAGRIDHALFLFAGCVRDAVVFPARGKASVCDSDLEDAPASGQWLMLDMSDDEIDELSIADWQKTILRALARYGALIGDTGGNEAIAFALESPASFESFGVPDPMIAWAETARRAPRSNIDLDVEGGERRYQLRVAKGVPWAEKLRVVDPCVIARRC